MGDPLNPWEDEDRLPPAGDLNEDSPALTGTINTMGGGSMIDSGGTMGGGGSHGDAMLDPDTADREAADAEQAAAGGVGDTGAASGPGGRADTDPGPDANDLEADNAVEQETIETLDPQNPPA
ncbi:hypothetical protein BCL57_000109 [Agromyces flavus]|uniref:Uncharacterized protein n=1 Tax=Agromyces flavus TaxID=589382 RepID=A0A1H1VMI8_9MICO|nr:hypothetical protein [Agromyces flavus]MCP2365967.1 hypothetical protein [Agromyces flavus]GGI43737.1 hypothetical protein GCM10010932_01090 [Agromyces flavus]SDS86107.1 hypothetical protein SAMN04489721_2041 [Agromyces flavus]